jgi:CRP-like cAMP-binding protein
MLQITHSSIENRLLALLAPADFEEILPYLEWVDLKVRDPVYGPDEVAEYAYFPVSGICSVIAVTGEGVKSETGIIGREGFVGSSIVLYAGSSPFEVVVQVSGRALRISRKNLQKVMTSNHGVLTLLLRFIHVFGVQTSQTAVANSRYTIPQRLARWLVMCGDRVDGEQFTMTHEFLSVMLTVRRAGVTDAINVLEGRKLIRATRGHIAIIDRAALQATAKGSYGVAEKEYKRLIK